MTRLTKVTLSTANTVPRLQVFIRLIIKEKIKTIKVSNLKRGATGYLLSPLKNTNKIGWKNKQNWPPDKPILSARANNCNISSVWKDQMSSNDSVATTTENTSRLGYKHVYINYLHVASHDYEKVIQHTHTSTQNHSIFSCSTPTSLSTQIQAENESSKYYWIKTISHMHVISRQKKGLEGTKVWKANIAR